MKSSQQTLFTLTLLPVLLCGAFLLWFVNHSPGYESTIPAALLLISVLVTASITIRHLRINFSEPLTQLAQQLEEPTLSVNVQQFNASSPIRHIASSLQELLKEKEVMHQDQMTALVSDHQQLKRGEFLNNQYTSKIRQQNLIDTCLIELSKPLLANLIAYTNLITHEYTFELQTDIKVSCKQILFLLHELQAHSYHGHKSVQTNIYNEIDETLGILHPILNSNDINITVTFSPSCPEFANLIPNSFKAVILNFILMKLFANDLIRSPDKLVEKDFAERNLVLEIDNVYRNDVDISLSPLQNFTPEILSPRLSTLADFFEVSFFDGRICIPLHQTEISPLLVSKEKIAQVFSENEFQQKNLESRLKKLGFSIHDEQNDLRIDLCFIAKKQHDKITSIAEAQEMTTLIILLGSQQYYQTENWHQLSFPLQNEALRNIIEVHYSAKVFDEVLALKRADNRPDLMKELLAILIESLTKDIRNLENALVQGKLTTVKELLHKIGGALRYSGTTKLSSSIGKFEDSVKNQYTPNDPLAAKAFTEVKQDLIDLESWYHTREQK
ncbi:MAG: HPt (histidine-containing phosphotransfer) domain-containing protein [Candidatus Azotimanducaceae bacterium]